MEDFGTLWSAISYVVTTAVGGFFGWLFTRRKYNEEVESVRVQNFDAAIEAYKKMYEDMIDDLKNQVNDLKEENATLKEELSENRKQIITLTNFVLASAIRSGENNDNFEDLKKIIK